MWVKHHISFNRRRLLLVPCKKNSNFGPLKGDNFRLMIAFAARLEKPKKTAKEKKCERRFICITIKFHSASSYLAEKEKIKLFTTNNSFWFFFDGISWAVRQHHHHQSINKRGKEPVKPQRRFQLMKRKTFPLVGRRQSVGTREFA